MSRNFEEKKEKKTLVEKINIEMAKYQQLQQNAKRIKEQKKENGRER